MKPPISLERAAAAFRPGESIRGTLDTSGWQAERVDLRLFWYTRGKGDTDSEVVQSQTFELPPADPIVPFEFKAPHRPYSFSNKLITLQWAIEAVLFPQGTAERVELIISPKGKEIVLAKDRLQND